MTNNNGDKMENSSESENTSLGGHLLYDRAKMVFESLNGTNEDGSDFGFSDYVRESIIDFSSTKKRQPVSESSKIPYFGGKHVVNESEIDDFDEFYKNWVRNGRNLRDLEISSFDNADIRRHKELLKRIWLKKQANRIDFDNNGFISRKEYDKYYDNHTDVNGKIPMRELLRGSGQEIKTGINNYLNQFMPMSWITGTENAIAKGAKGLFNKLGGKKLAKGYHKLGGNKALALGALGGLAFGPVGAIGGALAGKGLQKVVDYGNS